MSAPHDDAPEQSPPSADPAATRYDATPPADPLATRYSDTPADPDATVYPPTPEAPTARLPRRFGGYELLEEIGHGGMGVVYKARQFTPERLVALKVIRSGQLATAEDVRLFCQEADEAARLDHPNVVPVYEVGEHDGLHFFTMRLVEGGSLNQRLGRYRNDYKAAARLTATAARAVHYAHQRQLLHRDLKPGNILLDAAGQPHVADFGLAKRMGEGGEASQSQGAGTPEYMAPEQARGEKRLTTAADVYALGGVLYALLAGRPPFRGDTPLATMEKVRNEEPAPPSKVRPGVPRDLETICLKCLAKDAARRYGSAEALAEDLERWLKGEPVRGRPVGRMERAWLWCKRSPAAAGLLAAFVAALLIGTGVSTYFAVTSNANYLDARRHEKSANESLGTVKEEQKQLDDSNRRLEETLARSLLRPLGHQEDVVADPEVEALWELACLPHEQGRVRMQFVEQALQHLTTIRQLRYRADMALHAAIGLDLARRARTEQMLLSPLADPEGDFGIRIECVLIGPGLSGCSPGFAKAAARQAVEGMSKTSDIRTLRRLALAVSALAPRLGSEEAEATARQAVDAMGATTVPLVLRSLAEAEAALAARLGPEQAARLSSAAALRALDAMGDTTDPGALSYLAEAVAAVAPRLGPEEAARFSSAAARRILESMAATTLPSGPGSLALAVTFLAPQLGAEQSSAAARQFLDAMGKTKDSLTVGYLARAVAALASRLDSGEALAAVEQILKEIGTTTDVFSLSDLVRAAEALAPRLALKEAAAAAQLCMAAIGSATNPYAVSGLAQAQAALAARLSPEEAARLASAAARKVLDAMSKADNTYYLPPLSGALAFLAPWLGLEDSSAAVRRVQETMGRTKDPYRLAALAGVEAALAPRLGPEEAARLSSAAARQAVEVMSKPVGSSAALTMSGEVLVYVAPRLGTEQAAAAARQAVEAMGRLTFSNEQADLARAVIALVTSVGPDEVPRRAGILARVAGDATALPNLWVDLPELADASRPLPGRFTEQQLVDLIKMPTCQQPAREAIIRQLGWQCGQTFADQWQFVEWAQKNRPDLDLTSPPVRPDAP